MPAPSVEILWEGDNWLGWHKDIVEPATGVAIDLAFDLLEGVDIESQEPKQVQLAKVDRSDKFLGWAKTAGLFQLNFTKKRIKGLAEGDGILDLSCVAVHELTHCIRMEAFSSGCALEFAATEALAHLVDDIFSTEACGERSEYVKKALEIDKATAVLMWADFWMDQKLHPSREVVKRWFFDSNDGYFVALHSLARFAVREGLNPCDLIQIPAVDLMDIRQ